MFSPARGPNSASQIPQLDLRDTSRREKERGIKGREGGEKERKESAKGREKAPPK